ncbi:hypothetical protein BC828DRAFT_205675 [Blastocladiella britannica]|nr:hypothetical protein BC828DRAFT_205675 [Blastocladiella britannica]
MTADPAVNGGGGGPLPAPECASDRIFSGLTIAVLADPAPSAHSQQALDDALIASCAEILDRGGAYRLDLADARSLTHVVVVLSAARGAASPALERALVAAAATLGHGDDSEPPKSPPWHVVTGSWLHDCIAHSKLVHPDRYWLEMSGMQQHVPRRAAQGDPAPISLASSYFLHRDLDTSLQCNALAGKTLYLHGDISEAWRAKLAAIALANRAIVMPQMPPGSGGPLVDVAVMRYAQSAAYLSAREHGIAVASVFWLVDVMRTNRWSDPLDSVLHVPFPHRRPASTAKIVACVTEFIHRDREYVKELLAIVGLKYNSTMNAQTTHLIAARPAGQKFTLAANAPTTPDSAFTGVRVVNYHWLEDAALFGAFPDAADPRYCSFPELGSERVDCAGLSRVPPRSVARIDQECRAIVDRARRLAARELESLGVSGDAGDIAAGHPAAPRRAKLRGVDQVHRQYSMLDQLSEHDRRDIEKSWEDGAGGEFHALHQHKAKPVPGSHPTLEARTPGATSVIAVPSSNLRGTPVTGAFAASADTTPLRPNGAEATNPATPPRLAVVARSSATLALATPQPGSGAGAAAAAAPRALIRIMFSRRSPLPALTARVAALGAIVESHPTVGVSHLVTPEASSTERFLLSMASARFIVTPEWLRASAAAGHFAAVLVERRQV